jgi:hypothetical protein
VPSSTACFNWVNRIVFRLLLNPNSKKGISVPVSTYATTPSCNVYVDTVNIQGLYIIKNNC